MARVIPGPVVYCAGIALALLLAGLGLWHFVGPGRVARPAPDDDGVAILRGLARQALQDGRRVAPAGGNAYEFYLSLLQLRPADDEGRAALRQSFEAASADVEQAINRGQLGEAQRELALLREFDPDDYSLFLLTGKLDASYAMRVREDEAAARSMRQDQQSR